MMTMAQDFHAHVGGRGVGHGGLKSADRAD